MPEEIIRLAARDYEEAVDFMNLVFSHAYSPTDFPSLIPQLLQPTDEHMRYYYAIRRNGKIRSLVASFPLVMNVGEYRLKIAGIGAVSTHPYERGGGFMRQLMERCLDDMSLEGYHLSYLAGQRQRYGYYGYEKSGSSIHFTVKKENVKHYFRNEPESGLSFELVQDQHTEYLTVAKLLHDRQHVYFERPQDKFNLYLKSWKMEPWAIIDEKGKMAGYLVTNQDHSEICELVTDESVSIASVARNWVNRHTTDGSTFIMPLWNSGQIHILDGMCEDVLIGQCSNWRIIDWVTAISALLTLKSKLVQLPDGILTIGIDGFGTIQIQVADGMATCRITKEKPDVIWDAFTATRILFGPLPHNYITDIPGICIQALAWFPLPLYMPHQDKV